MLTVGLNAVSATFRQLIEKVMQGIYWQTQLLYINDIILVASDFHTYLGRLAELFQWLQLAELKLKPKNGQY